jgi:putative DNA primase/helicase
MRALETLLSIVGQDGININRKHLPELPDHKLMCRFTIAVNELPQLPDHSQALEPRLLVLDFGKCFVGCEDRTLKLRLPREAAGIANWSLRGLQRLRERGVFTEPDSTKRTLEEFRRVTSPVVQFVEEACIREKDAEVAKPDLYDAWTGWCREKGIQPGPRARLGERVVASFPDVWPDKPAAFAKQRAVYRGLRLDEWAIKAYLGRPN